MLFVYPHLSKSPVVKMSKNSKKQNPKVAIYSMPALYQINDLIRCEGDPFDNFVNFNIAFFNAMNEEGT